MSVAFKIYPFLQALGAAFVIRVPHGTYPEAFCWRISPVPVAICHSVNHLLALKLNPRCLSHAPLLWGNNKISISGTFELVYQR